MADPIQVERVINELADLIDREHKPKPSPEALNLARSVVSLVKDRGPRVCVVLSATLDRLALDMQ